MMRRENHWNDGFNLDLRRAIEGDDMLDERRARRMQWRSAQRNSAKTQPVLMHHLAAAPAQDVHALLSMLS